MEYYIKGGLQMCYSSYRDYVVQCHNHFFSDEESWRMKRAVLMAFSNSGTGLYNGKTYFADVPTYCGRRTSEGLGNKASCM